MFRLFLSSFFILYSTFVFSGGLDYKSATDCSGDNSFNWYCQKPEEKPIPKPPVKKYKNKSHDAIVLDKFNKLVKDLEDAKNIAIMEPSYRNMKRYIALQLKIQTKSSVFTDSWQRVLWQNPELDYGNKFTVNTAGKQEYRRILAENKLSTLKELSDKGWGIWFFYSSDCPYCERITPSVNLISHNGLTVLPISMDGKPLKGLNLDYVPNRGQASKLGVKVTPSIYLVNGNTRFVVPIASGIISYDDLITRIYIIVKTKPGENY